MKLSVKQKKFADTYARTGIPGQSYKLAFGQNNMKYANVCAHKFLNDPRYKHVQDYLAHTRNQIEKKYNFNKESLIRDLLDIKSKYQDLYDLGAMDHLNDREQDKFDRLTTLLKGSDITRTNDQLAKLMGAYEPEKVEIKHEWTISFGEPDDPLDEELQDGDIEDVEFTEEDE